MKVLKYLSSVFCQMNNELFSDEKISEIKTRVIQFNEYFLKYCKYCNITTGIKYHKIWHCFEFVEFHRFSTAWINDERGEAAHPFIRISWTKYVRYGEEKQLFYVGKDVNNRVLLRSHRPELKPWKKKSNK